MEVKDYININLKDEYVSDRHIKHLVIDHIDTAIGKVPRIKTKIELKDKIGAIKVRLGIKRNDYRIPPGLYAVGKPDENSLVLATSNYKLTFDELRKELEGLNVWILVLDTKGINVWCAAGKGTFGTKELINRIRKTNLSSIVKNKTIILPQLGASNMISHIVTKITGFKIIYGPIKSRDIKRFIENGFKATEDMRKVTFNLTERLVLTPIEFVHSLKYFPIIFFAFLIINFMNGVSKINDLFFISFMNSIPYFISIIIGTILFPILLPYLPFIMFSAKGAFLGILWSIIFWFIRNNFMFEDNLLNYFGNSIIMTTIISFLSMNFTGSTTFTSFSGVQRETLVSVPIMIVVTAIGTILMIFSIFV